MSWLFEVLIYLSQFLIFYAYPWITGPEDIMGLIVVSLTATFILSAVLGIVSDKRLRFLYPVIIAVMFIPSVFLYYNDSALIYAGWYFLVSMIGMLIGTIINLIIRR